MCKVGRKSCMEAGGGYGEGSSDSFAPQGYYVLLVVRVGQLLMNLQVRPVRITVSNVAMKSVMTVSALFRPARTAMMSELGFVYFLVKAASKKAVKVWLVSQWMRLQGPACSFLKRDLVRGWSGLLDRVYGTAKELLGMRLDVQHFVGGHFAQDALQTC